MCEQSVVITLEPATLPRLSEVVETLESWARAESLDEGVPTGADPNDIPDLRLAPADRHRIVARHFSSHVPSARRAPEFPSP
ncbi:hypothetical protein W59_20728 [Rhodococcus opacus RKJ300 = JCM 13270]|uniref:Uncharacterized protein n=1 Tax=Rhodococcus opacus RKJ300 = JCM 13270 TaxID=1165867 RepID=I0WNR9_RHOOP|nr:hypothetical protein W59_20728 [Rhodococcus opacus RKJ300 = JCM 13270]